MKNILNLLKHFKTETLQQKDFPLRGKFPPVELFTVVTMETRRN